MKHTKSYIKGHPNPQFSRKDFINLNGKWEFCFDDDNKGIINKYFDKFPKTHDINVPYTYECKNSGINLDEEHNIVWYNKSFEYKLNKDKKTLLHFEGVDYETRVYINGTFVKEHIGGYSSFSVDITDYLVDGENKMTVRVYDDKSCARPRGKQRWLKDKHSIFYVATTGIYKSVWLENVSLTYLKKVLINPLFNKNAVEIEYEFIGDIANYEIETVISVEGDLVSKERKTITRNIFTQTFDVRADNATMKVHEWDYVHPTLYDVEFNVYKDNILVDQIGSYFGMVYYHTMNNHIYINNWKKFLKLVLDQGYSKDGGLTLSEEEIIEDITLMKDIGLNGCRKHQKIESHLFYYYCDILGFHLWQELPSCYDWNSITQRNIIDEWTNILYEHHNHPCIMSNVIINESWGTPRIEINEEQQRFVDGLYYLTKSIERDRFVISNDGWGHTTSDLYTAHDYSSSYEKTKKVIEEAIYEKDNYGEITQLGYHTLSSYNHKSLNTNKPIIMSEFAGIAFKQEEGWGYGDLVNNEEEYLTRLKGVIQAISESSLFSGYCITQLTDTYQEINGLFTFDRKDKVNRDKLRDIIKTYPFIN